MKRKLTIYQSIEVKVFGEDEINLAQVLLFVFDRLQNILGNGEKMLFSSVSSFSFNVFKRFLFHCCQTRDYVVKT